MRGTITIDGEPMVWASVSFIPEDPSAPVAWVHTRGEFQIDAVSGPLAGVHRVEVAILSKDLSDMKSGRYSKENAERYTGANPNASTPLNVEIESGKELHLSIFSK